MEDADYEQSIDICINRDANLNGHGLFKPTTKALKLCLEYPDYDWKSTGVNTKKGESWRISNMRKDYIMNGAGGELVKCGEVRLG